jgi:hypothetical protein
MVLIELLSHNDFDPSNVLDFSSIGDKLALASVSSGIKLMMLHIFVRFFLSKQRFTLAEYSKLLSGAKFWTTVDLRGSQLAAKSLALA